MKPTKTHQDEAMLTATRSQNCVVTNGVDRALPNMPVFLGMRTVTADNCWSLLVGDDASRLGEEAASPPDVDAAAIGGTAAPSCKPRTPCAAGAAAAGSVESLGALMLTPGPVRRYGRQLSSQR